MATGLLLLGATGYTGRLILSELVRGGKQVRVAGRQPDELRELAEGHEGVEVEPEAVDHEDAASVRRVVDGSATVITAVGPYSVFGWEVARACATMGKNYVDVTGEQDFVRRSFEESSSEAVESGACLVHSCSFESALADLLARRACPVGLEYEDLSTYYQFATSRPSPGTRLTMKLVRTVPNFRAQDGQLHEAVPLTLRHEQTFAERPEHTTALFMPYPEVIFFAHRYSAKACGSYVLMTEGEADLATSRPVGEVKSTEFYVAQHHQRPRPGPSESERAAQGFGLGVRGRAVTGELNEGFVSGRDMYKLTALIAVEAAHELQSGLAKPGIHAPAEILSVGFLDRILDRGHLQLTIR